MLPYVLRNWRDDNKLTRQELGLIMGYKGPTAYQAVQRYEEGEGALAGPAMRLLEVLAKSKDAMLILGGYRRG